MADYYYIEKKRKYVGGIYEVMLRYVLTQQPQTGYIYKSVDRESWFEVDIPLIIMCVKYCCIYLAYHVRCMQWKDFFNVKYISIIIIYVGVENVMYYFMAIFLWEGLKGVCKTFHKKLSLNLYSYFFPLQSSLIFLVFMSLCGCKVIG